MVTINATQWYEDKKWLENLNVFLDAMKDDDDLLLLFDGAEGAGKSKRLRQVAMYCANYLGTSFSAKNIKFNMDEYVDFSIESPLYTVCVLDESRRELNKLRSNSRSNIKFTNYLSECRKKRQVHIVALPAFHDLNSYLVNWRCKGLVHIHKWYEEDKTRESGFKLGRGAYTFYLNGDQLRKWYQLKYYYPKQFTLKGKFSNVETLSPEDLKIYDDQKDENIEKRYHTKYEQEELGKLEKRYKQKYIKFIASTLDNKILDLETIELLTGEKRATIVQMMQRNKDKLQV